MKSLLNALFSVGRMNADTDSASEESVKVIGLNSIYFETIEKQYKYYTNLSCHGLCFLAVWPGKVIQGRVVHGKLYT